MLALLRLAVYSLLFGFLCVIFYFAARLALRAVLPLSSDFPEDLASRLQTLLPMRRREGKRRRLFLFLHDLSMTLFFFLSLIVFFYWQADGTVRLFSLLAIFLGGALARTLYRRRLKKLEDRLIFLVKYALLFVIRPYLALLLRIGGSFLAFLKKILGFFIKILKRYDTVFVSYRYKKRTLRAVASRRRAKAILLAMGGGGDEG